MSESSSTAPETSQELQALVQVGHQYIALQSKELDIKKIEIESNTQIALASIEAQKEVSAHDRTHEGGQETRKYVFATVMAAVVIGGMIALVMIGAKDLVSDMLKIVLGFAAGAFGGFHYGKNKANTDYDGDE